jgi:hypothetical protein
VFWGYHRDREVLLFDENWAGTKTFYLERRVARRFSIDLEGVWHDSVRSFTSSFFEAVPDGSGSNRFMCCFLVKIVELEPFLRIMAPPKQLQNSSGSLKIFLGKPCQTPS